MKGSLSGMADTVFVAIVTIWVWCAAARANLGSRSWAILSTPFILAVVCVSYWAGRRGPSDVENTSHFVNTDKLPCASTVKRLRSD